ncbi:MAG: hypothetical protein WCW26_04665 [Candidatus Buchananbacteria bacterium]
MAKKSVKTKKTTTQKPCCSNWEQELSKLGNDLMSGLKTAKKKYDKLDDKTRKEIIVGVASVVGILAGAKMVKKIGKKK